MPNYMKRIVPQSETGRIVKPTNFYLCCTGNVLLIVGVSLLLTSIWSILYKDQFKYLVGRPIEISYFTIPASVLCIFLFWISYSIHNNEKFGNFISFLLTLNGFTVALLFVAVYLGFTAKFEFNHKQQLDGELLIAFNDTMFHAMLNYNKDENYRRSWNCIQTRYYCCGIFQAKDWLEVLAKIPTSCHNLDLYRGCLNVIAKNLFWQNNLITGLNSIAGITLFSGMILEVFLYFLDKCGNQ